MIDRHDGPPNTRTHVNPVRRNGPYSNVSASITPSKGLLEAILVRLLPCREIKILAVCSFKSPIWILTYSLRPSRCSTTPSWRNVFFLPSQSPKRILGKPAWRSVTSIYDNTVYRVCKRDTINGSTLNGGEHAERRIYGLGSLEYAGRLMKWYTTWWTSSSLCRGIWSIFAPSGTFWLLWCASWWWKLVSFWHIPTERIMLTYLAHSKTVDKWAWPYIYLTPFDKFFYNPNESCPMTAAPGILAYTTTFLFWNSQSCLLPSYSSLYIRNQIEGSDDIYRHGKFPRSCCRQGCFVQSMAPSIWQHTGNQRYPRPSGSGRSNPYWEPGTQMVISEFPIFGC